MKIHDPMQTLSSYLIVPVILICQTSNTSAVSKRCNFYHVIGFYLRECLSLQRTCRITHTFEFGIVACEHHERRRHAFDPMNENDNKIWQ